MNHSPNVLRKELTLVNELGLHARSAAKIAEMAQNAKHKVWVRYGDETVDAASIIDILTLGAACGSRIEIAIENADDTPVLQAIADLVEAGFGE